MDISKHMHNDHAELRSLAQDILQAREGADVGSRDNQFDLYDLQVRRHLAVVEEVLINPLKRSPGAAEACADIRHRHRELRRDLSALDRPGKDSNEWAAEFRAFVDEFEAVCRLHEALLHHGERLSGDLGEQYQQAKLRRAQGGPWSWAAIPSGRTAAVAGAAAALAGAAIAAGYLRSSGSRRASRASDEFELKLETDENLRLISSSKVEGTPVVDREGTKIGTIQNFMVDKYSGRVAYAVMRFGGTFGFGASLFPLPWPVLTYNESAGGYQLDVAKEDMANAPRFEANDEPEFDPEYRRSILLFYRPISAGSYSPASTPDSWNADTARTASSTDAGTTSEQTARPEPFPARS